MKKTSFKIPAVMLIVLCTASSAMAQPSYMSGKQYNRVTFWNKVTDFASTIGKDDNEKRQILIQRRNERRLSRMKKHQQKIRQQNRK